MGIVDSREDNLGQFSSSFVRLATVTQSSIERGSVETLLI